MRERAVELSIVTTLYRSGRYIEEFYRRAVAAAEKLGRSFELVFVNDGSPDESLALALAVARSDPRVTVVDLSRNFGHHMAFMAGLDHSAGERIFFIDVDLEEEPEWLADFDRELDRKAADMVYGFQHERAGGSFRRWSGKLFYGLFNRVSDQPIPENPCTVRLLSRRYANALQGLRDRNLFLAGNYAWVGFEQVGMPVVKKVRASRSSYGLIHLMRLFVNAVVSFSAAPLRTIFFVGLAISSLSGLLGLIFLVQKLLDPSKVALGWASVMVSIWFLSGTLIFICGILGLYIGAIFAETKHRPPYVVRAVHRLETTEETGEA